MKRPEFKDEQANGTTVTTIDKKLFDGIYDCLEEIEMESRIRYIVCLIITVVGIAIHLVINH